MQHIMASFHHHDMFDIWQLFNGHTALIALLLTFFAGEQLHPGSQRHHDRQPAYIDHRAEGDDQLVKGPLQTAQSSYQTQFSGWPLKLFTSLNDAFTYGKTPQAYQAKYVCLRPGYFLLLF